MEVVLLEYEKLSFDEKLTVLAGMLTIVANSYDYVTDHTRSDMGKMVFDEDMDDPSEARSGDCEVCTALFFSKLVSLFC